MSFVICKVGWFTITYYISTCFVFGQEFGLEMVSEKILIDYFESHFDQKESFI